MCKVYDPMDKIRVRFAPSPTGPLHIGGVRTALYNYLFAKKHGGDFILRIEDTDRSRYVPGAEEYIFAALAWCGLPPDEGPQQGGESGPYRQSERQSIYRDYAHALVKRGSAYYAFDTPEELVQMRDRLKDQGIHSPKYDATTRGEMKNSLVLDEDEVNRMMQVPMPFVVRLKVDPGHTITFNDKIRGEVAFESDELDDKVLFKADGMPTYHMANVIDDHHMGISHVIRGEEWLSSTAHHVLLYRALGWEDEIPAFAHLPLILKPSGKGKLSKRDGAKFGFPVFPLSWDAGGEAEHFEGFDSFGFDPEAVVNFLALLGWNPGTEEEIFSMDELISRFSLDHIHKAGARFDFEKACWFNEQYIHASSPADLAEIITRDAEPKGYDTSAVDMGAFCRLLQPRVTFYTDFLKDGYYFFEDVREYEEKPIRKKWSQDKAHHLGQITALVGEADPFSAEVLSRKVKQYMADHELGFGQVFPFLRIALSGTTKGPDLFEMMSVMGKGTVCKRLEQAIPLFDQMKQGNE